MEQCVAPSTIVTAAHHLEAGAILVARRSGRGASGAESADDFDRYCSSLFGVDTETRRVHWEMFLRRSQADHIAIGKSDLWLTNGLLTVTSSSAAVG